MSTADIGIEQAIECLQGLVAEDGSLVREFQESQVEFFGSAAPPSSSAEESRLAARRHLEWFLLERYSEHLQGVPVEALLEEWSLRVRGPAGDLANAFLASRAGVFAVTGIRGGEGIWLQDLLGLGEYPIEEPLAAAGLGVGDVIVGRVHPIGESVYRVSPAAACFRNAELLEALGADMERLRESRRGIARISQRDLELMFFRAPGRAPSAPPEDALRALLEEAGVPRRESEAILARLADVDRDVDENPVGDLLDQLAFHTRVDLERARLLLLEAWSTRRRALAARAGRSGSSGSIGSSEAVGEGARPVPDRAAVDAALAAFDRGRAAGVDLEALFHQLEESLGLEPDAGSEPVEPSPAFPGVVGAMVEEFLWETERESGAERRARYGPLRSLGRYAEGIEHLGVFENFGARDLLLYLSCWSVEHAELAGADDARRLTEAAAAFAAWARKHHALAIEARAGERLERIGPDLGRVIEANRHVAADAPAAPAVTGREIYGELRIEDGRDRLVPAQGATLELRVPAHARRWLRTGDLARAVRAADGSWDLACSYPPQAVELLGGTQPPAVQGT